MFVERERELQAQLKRVGITFPSASVTVRPLRLNAAELAKGNNVRERELRQQQVVGLVRQEPPRRTVTGSFAVH
jgi:hypothetical protein